MLLSYFIIICRTAFKKPFMFSNHLSSSPVLSLKQVLTLYNNHCEYINLKLLEDDIACCLCAMLIIPTET